MIDHRAEPQPSHQCMLGQMRRVQIDHHDGLAVNDFPRIEKVVKLLSHCAPGRLLDIGYSKGSFADLLVEKGWKCTGLDLNKHTDTKIKTIQCDLNFSFPVESETFDAVTAGEVIEHMIDQSAFLQECRRVLKRDGFIVITTPNLSFSVNRLLVFAGKTPMFVYEPYHYHFHTRKTIYQLVEQHGFRIHRVTASHVLYSRRRHSTGRLFEWLGDLFPTFGAHLIVFAQKQ